MTNAESNDYGEAILSITKVRNESYSPHGAIGEHIRPTRPSSACDLDQLFGNLAFDEWNRPATVMPLVQELPTLMPIEDDPAFKNDLAHVLVWFEEDLSSQQRISAIYTLARHLSKWQLEILLKFLMQDEKSIGTSPPNGSSPLSSVDSASFGSTTKQVWPKVTSPEPYRPPGLRPTWAVRPPLDSLPVSADLFFTDLSAWLRLHRLHKYEPNLIRLDRHGILQVNDSRLEELGVKALGARRKFLRLFEAIKAEI